ncbi:MAG TPA: hypothetical protein ENH72_14865 [Pseudomonas sabulinigri]|uniref:Uncharacterized protein n=1 Tax=marine sediment metagenome TaxID=412755 RepID=A0A0F9V727_9ZZZZ|nr:hypothetical protein [Halopseudomonas sabulinigri]HEC50774.1 hypothetical protein [Halopseudomonas sabulinigri]
MDDYFVNKNAQSNGDHEVHKSGCNWMPHYKIALGPHLGCYSAVLAARTHYPQSNGCAFCSPLCHTS